MDLVFLMLVTLSKAIFFFPFKVGSVLRIVMVNAYYGMLYQNRSNLYRVHCSVYALVEHFEKVRLWLRKNILILLLREVKILNNQTSTVNCNVFRCLHFNQDHSKTTNSTIKYLVSQQNLGYYPIKVMTTDTI